MNTNGLTPGTVKRQHAAVIPKSDTFGPIDPEPFQQGCKLT